MAADRYAARRQKLIHNLKAKGADALLVTNFTNVTYLTGFTGDDSYLLVGKDKTLLISDGRYTTQISQECPELEVYIRTQKQTIYTATVGVLTSAKIPKLGFESSNVTVAELEKLQGELKSQE